jgi:hypothetical protein
MKPNLLVTVAITIAGLCGVAYAELTPTTVNPFKMVNRSTETTSTAIPMISPEVLDNALPGQSPLFNTGSLLSNDISLTETSNDTTNMPEIYGVINSYSGTGGFTGLVLVPTEGGHEFNRITTGSASAIGSQTTSGTETDGILYMNTPISRYGSLYCTYHQAYDIDSWQRVSFVQGSEFYLTARDMATDPTTGKMYGIFMKTDASTAFVIAEYIVDSYASGSITHRRRAICDLPHMFTALFFTADGQMWGIDLETEKDSDGNETTKSASLYKIDKNTGELTLIGDTGAKPYYASSAVCDVYNTGKIYWSVKTKDLVGSLYTVDLATGHATKVYDFPHNEEIVCMFVKSRPQGAAPSAVENLRLNTSNGSLSGSIDFDVPTTTYDGSIADGEVDYTVTLAGSTFATGKAKYGSKVSLPFEVSYTGLYSVSARLSNESGKGPQTTISDYIGIGRPSIPQNVKAIYDNGKVAISWDSVTGSVENLGYIDTSKIRYKVVRTSDNTTLVEDYNSTSYIDTSVANDGNLGYYRYSVYATAGETVSGEGKSEAVIYGDIIPPFTDHFDDVYHIYETNGDQSLSLYKQVKVTGSSTVHWYVHSSTKAATIWPSSSVVEDSWVITPSIKLEAGKTYTVSMYAWSGYTTKSKGALSMFIGKAQDVDSLTTQLMEPDVINVKVANKKYKYSDFTVPESGIYYIGIRCTSNKESNQYYFDDLTISEAIAHGRPAIITDLTATVSGTGSYDANIKFTAPANTIEGVALEDSIDISLKRNGEEIKTWKSVAPGTAITYTDTCDKDGNMTYSVVSSNSVGSSDETTATTYVGFYTPKPASAASLEDLGDGNVKVSWTPVFRDSKNKTLTTDQIRFCIVGPDPQGSGNAVIIKDDIAGSETGYTFKAYDPNNNQGLIQYGVAQKTNAGYSDIKYTNMQPVGKAYTAPYDDSFTGTNTHVLYAATTSGTVLWQLVDNSVFTGVSAADGDNSYLAMYSVYNGGQGYVGTGIIDLTGIEHPGVSFMVYNINGGISNANEISVSVSTGGEYTSVRTTQVYSLGYANGWCKYVAKLDKYADKKVLIKISISCTTYGYNFIDNLHVGEIPVTDLSVIGHSITPEIEENENAQYSVMFLNNGYNDTTFSTNLLMNGKVVATKELSIANGESAIATFSHRPDVDAGTEVTYNAVAVASDDADATDNSAEEVTVKVMQPAYPTVTTLTAKNVGDVNHLSWETPELTYVPNPRTETFEKGSEPWTDIVKNWTLLDVDKLPISLGTANGVFPDIATGDSLGMFVWDTTDMTTQQQASIYYQAHSGTRYIGKAAPSDRSQFGDDWAISPELFGCAQTISLYARSESSQSPENVEVLYSNGSIDPKDFISLLKVIDVPQLWTNYQVDLPGGAKRLAIRAYSSGTFFLHVDDVRFIPTAEELSIAGYHVWRDGERITTEPIATTSYDDTKGESDALSHAYKVSVVYNVGESCPSNEVTCDFSGVENVSDNEAITISTRKGSVVVSGADGQNITIYLTDGRIATSVIGDDVTSIDLATGIYVVKVGNKVAKVVIR